MLLNDKIDVIFCYIPQVSIILPKKLLHQNYSHEKLSYYKKKLISRFINHLLNV